MTDLFIEGSSRFSAEQIAVFDDILLCLTEEIEHQARAALAHSIASITNAPPKVKPADVNAHRPIRVGYLSSDFRSHTVAGFIELLLTHHDRKQFHVSA